MNLATERAVNLATERAVLIAIERNKFEPDGSNLRFRCTVPWLSVTMILISWKELAVPLGIQDEFMVGVPSEVAASQG